VDDVDMALASDPMAAGRVHCGAVSGSSWSRTLYRREPPVPGPTGVSPVRWN